MLFSAERKYDNDVNFRVFKKKLYHSSITAILKTLKPGMTVPVVHRCPDGHYCRCIYDLAAFIADYPEQVLLAGIVQGWCCRWVDTTFLDTIYILKHLSSCTAPSSNLNVAADRRTRDLDEVLLDEYGGDGKVLWDNYGVDDDVTVRRYWFSKRIITDLMFVAIYSSFPSCRHSWDAFSGSSAPNHQGLFQRYARWVGLWLSSSHTWGKASRWDYGWCWLLVSDSGLYTLRSIKHLVKL